jgi:hypothetical protein
VLLQRVPQRVVGVISPWNNGVGWVGGRFSMDRLTELKTIVVDLG